MRILRRSFLKRSVLIFGAGLLGFLLFWMIPGYAQTVVTDGFSTVRAQIVRRLASADVIYLGETHNRPEDRQAQLQIIQALAQKGKVAIAMEMFQRPYQGAIDAYLSRQISETELLEQTEYEQRWGFPWDSYAPILRFAQARKIPVLAINTPSEVTRKVARQGLEVLTPEDWQWLPQRSEIRTDNSDYRQLLGEVFQQHQAGGHGNSEGFERFFLAQVVWDETMAHHIVQFIDAHPGYQVVVIAGQGHIIYGYGIPSRVARRLGDRSLRQYSVLFNQPDPGEPEAAMADFFW